MSEKPLRKRRSGGPMPDPMSEEGEGSWRIYKDEKVGGRIGAESPDTGREWITVVPLSRATQAERERDELREALERIAFNQVCIEVQFGAALPCWESRDANDYLCPRCEAWVALHPQDSTERTEHG
jgi:hypothetical protein